MTTETNIRQRPTQSLRRIQDVPEGDIGQLASLAKAILSKPHPPRSMSSLLALRIYRTGLGTTDVRVIITCLNWLLSLGNFGSILAMHLVHSRHVPHHDMEAAVSGLNPARGLALAHRMLLGFPGRNDRQTLEWLEGLAAKLAKSPLEGLLPTLEDLGRKRIRLAFPLRQALLTGPLYEAITRQIQAGQDIPRLCLAITCLDSEGLASTLAWAMRSGTIAATPTALLCVAELAPADDKPTFDLLRAGMTKKPAVRAALRGVRKRNWAKTGLAAGRLLTQQPKFAPQVTAEVLGFGSDFLDETLAHLKDDQRTEFLCRAFAALCGLDPFFARTALVGLAEGDTDRVEAMLKAAGIKDTVPPKAIFPPAAAPTTEPKKNGLFGKLISGNKDVIKFLDGKKKYKNNDLSGATLLNEILADREMPDIIFDDIRIENSSLTRCLITDTTLHGARIAKTAFEDSIFRNCDLSESFVEKCTFDNCVFEYCDLSLAGLSRCKFKNCRFQACSLAEATIVLSRFKYCRLNLCSLARTDLRDTIIKVTVLEGCDLSRAALRGCSLFGLTMDETTLDEALLHDCSFINVTLHLCTAMGTEVESPEIFHPDLQLARENRLETMAPPTATPDQAPEDLALIEGTLRMWSNELDYSRRERIMLGNNQRRLGLSLRKAGGAATFIKLLPLLLHTDLFEQRDGLTETPACNVAGYYPAAEELELAAQYFPGLVSSRRAPSVRILGVYSIGSLGSVAQTSSSDLDCWVCVEDRGATAKSLDRLSVKLQAMELWAMSEFKLELHFFLMKMSDIRANDFGLSDEESSGSAQAQLLKEEFYRTALKLAGLDLGWWFVPPGVDDLSYERHMEVLAAYPLGGTPRVEDFGHLGAMPVEEFFGASLWQIVKALHSPFKSVLKLGVLEMYSHSKPGYLPLCDRIKNNLFAGNRNFLELDPYALLFHELKGYYALRNNEDAVRLLTESFLLKADLSNVLFFARHPAMRAERDLLDELFGGYAAPELIQCGGEEWTFERSVAVGRSVQRFMVNTYKQMREALKAAKAVSAITPEDMTRLGRRVAALFSNKKNKVSRIPFVDIDEDGFPVLHFSAMKSAGKLPLWIIRGAYKYDPKTSIKEMQVLVTNRDPAILFSWLMANKLFQPRGVILADRSISPLSVQDIQDCLTALWDFFPFDDVFERSMEEGLNPERITRCFFINNLTVPAKETEIKSCSVVYATNWGEMYCHTFNDPPKDLPHKPGLFMEDYLPHKSTVRTVIDYWMPHGARCPKVLI